MRKIFAITVIAALLAPAAFAAGEVYRWKGANGIWQYTDQPRPGAELVRRAPVATASTAAPAATPVPAAPPPVSASEVLPVTPQVAQEVRQDAAARKAELCAKARKDYEDKLSAVRIYRTGADGQRTFYTEAEVDAARMEARSARDLACGP